MHMSDVRPAEALPVEAVVFDLGGVLLDWDPRHLYRKLLPDDGAVEHFLSTVCTPEWHEPHDRGVPTAASCAELAVRHPDSSDLILAWAERGEEMVGGVIAGSIDVLADVKRTGVPCYALTNMEAETYPLRRARFPFLSWFDGTVVSGVERVAKPDPEIFHRMFDRFGLQPSSTLMIDDRSENLDTAAGLGMQTLLFRSFHQLRGHLAARGLVAGSAAPALR